MNLRFIFAYKKLYEAALRDLQIAYQKNITLENTIIDMRKRFGEETRENRRTIAELKELLQQLTTQRDGYLRSVNALTDTAENQTREIEYLKQEIEDYEAGIRGLDERNEAMADKLARKAADIFNLRSRIEDLEKIHAGLDAVHANENDNEEYEIPAVQFNTSGLRDEEDEIKGDEEEDDDEE